MKRSLLSAVLAFAVAIGSIGIVPLANAAAGDSTIFFMTNPQAPCPALTPQLSDGARSATWDRFRTCTLRC